MTTSEFKLQNDIQGLKEYLREKYYLVDMPRNGSVISYHKMIERESQSLAELTTKLRDIEIDHLLEDINENDYIKKKTEVLDIDVRDKDYIRSVSPEYFYHQLDKNRYSIQTGNAEQYTDVISHIMRDFERKLFQQFQEMLQDIKVEVITDIYEFQKRVNFFKYNSRQQDLNLYHYMSQRPDLNMSFNETNLLVPYQVLITPAVYFDVVDIMVTNYMTMDSPYGSNTIGIDYYLDIIEKENSVILDLKF